MGAPVVLGFDFGGSKTRIAVADLQGNRLAERTTDTDPTFGARWNLDRAVGAARALLDETGHSGDLAAVGASTFGIPTERGVLLAPAIPGWEDLALGWELVKALQCPAVRVGTDVKAATAAEARSGALVGADPGLYLNLGTGLAVGIVFGGRVVTGANGAAGEIGYNLRQLSDLDAGPEQERTRLEDVVSGMALAATATRVSGLDMTAAQVFEGEAANDGLAAALDGFVRELTFHIVNLTIALNPTRIAVGGGIVRSWGRIEPKLRQALDAFVPFPPELVTGAFPYDAALVGAIALGIQEARFPVNPARVPTDRVATYRLATDIRPEQP